MFHVENIKRLLDEGKTIGKANIDRCYNHPRMCITTGRNTQQNREEREREREIQDVRETHKKNHKKSSPCFISIE